MRNNGWKGQWRTDLTIWRTFHCGQTEEFVPEILGVASAIGSSILTQSICPSVGSVVSYQPSLSSQ